jgi:hypothetical protein
VDPSGGILAELETMIAETMRVFPQAALSIDPD